MCNSIKLSIVCGVAAIAVGVFVASSDNHAISDFINKTKFQTQNKEQKTKNTQEMKMCVVRKVFANPNGDAETIARECINEVL